MDESSITAYLALRHSDTVSDQQFSELIRQYGSIKNLLAAPGNEEIDEAVRHPAEKCRKESEREREWAEQDKNQLLFYESPQYPALLREISHPPPVLAVRGNPRLNGPQIALVGSRNCSIYGKRTAFWLARELASLGLAITSGLALGIDTASHEGALEAEPGYDDDYPCTVAVVANGLDTVYPRRNASLFAAITERGAIVSEFPPGTKPLAGYFPRRNRLISGLSQGVVIIEAAMKSGSLITARLAMEQNREVFAVPGPLRSAYSEGSNWLIKNGAKLIDGPGDILTELNSTTLASLRNDGQNEQHKHLVGERTTDPQCRKLLALIRGQTLHFDELRDLSNLHTDSLSATLLQLEILGLIEMRAGRIYPL